MKMLAFEFSSAQRSVAVVCDGVHLREVLETGRANTMRPFAMMDAVLAEAGLERAAIEVLVVGLGPGSYTGIRAAIAVAQGWQLARNVRLLGVSSAAAIAQQARRDGLRGPAHVVVDAQRGEWYLATWELDDQTAREVAPLRIVNAAEVAERAARGGVVIGPEAPRCVPSGRLVFPRAALLAELAAGRTDFVDGPQLEPIYLRETAFVKAPPPRIL
jgi:tRNA threonylcarbamoyladenosine biosynthesis protein TsaB